MVNTETTTESGDGAPATGSGLIRSRTAIQAARARGGMRSDGGSTGRSDTND